MRLSWAAGPGCCALPVFPISCLLLTPPLAFPNGFLLFSPSFSLAFLSHLNMSDLENSNRNWGRGRAKPSP